MKQSPQGVQSTKVRVKVEKGAELSVQSHIEDSDIFIKTIHHKQTIYTDQPGPFPVISRTGNRYQMVLCEIDSNAILVKALPSKPCKIDRKES
jgi:hypothetical protein